MNFFAIPTLKNVRACLRLPSSMIPRCALKVTLARLRTGMDSVGSLLRSAAVITVSATLTSFFSTSPEAFALAMVFYLFFRLAGGRFAALIFALALLFAADALAAVGLPLVALAAALLPLPGGLAAAAGSTSDTAGA